MAWWVLASLFAADGRGKGEFVMITENSDVQETPAQTLGEFWEGYTGARPENVRIVAGDQAVAVWLRGALSPAERQLAGSKARREVLEEVGERILEQAKPKLLHLVEVSVHQDAILIDAHQRRSQWQSGWIFLDQMREKRYD